MKSNTRIIHHPYKAPSDFEAPQIGVHKASTVIFPNVQNMREREWLDKSSYTYGLHGTPTTFTLEERLCEIEGGKHCVLVPSGLAAIAQVNFAFLKTGDEILLPDHVYGPSKVLAAGELKNFGITCQYYDALNPDDLSQRISSKTKLVWLEAPGSVTLEFPSLMELIKRCKQKNILTALDNTWGAGIAFNAFDLTPDAEKNWGVDITVHALTKYPSGGGDVLMGSVMTHRDDLAQTLKLSHMRMGQMVGANDAEMVLRSLSTMRMRYLAQDSSARAVSQWLSTRAEIAQVLHPALPQSPGHAHWKALTCHPSSSPTGWAAGLLSVMIDARFTSQQVDAFCDGLNIFKLGYSWGGPMSLVVPYRLQTIRSQEQTHLQKGHLVRFAMGLEDADDLINDLQQSIEKNLKV